jgi:DNA polymerase-3 subunit delta
MELAESRLLVERVGDGQQMLLRELEKLGMYKGRGRVTAEDVALLSPRSLEASIFDLVDAVSTRRGADAFTAIEELYAAGERPVGLHFRLLRHFQQLTRVVALRAEGWPSAQIQAELKVKPYAAKKLLQQSQRYSVETVTAALAILAATDARLKGMGDLPEQLELELCVGSLLALEG